MGIRVQPFTQILKSNIVRFARHTLTRRLYDRLQFGSALGLGVGFLLSFFIVTGIFGTSSSRLADFFYQSPPLTDQVVLIALDDKSLKQVGELPWSRTTLAQLIDKIVAGTPRVVALDLILSNSLPDDIALAQALGHAKHIVFPIIGVDETLYPVRSNSFPQFSVTLTPATILQNNNTKLGHTIVSIDDDGIVRRLPLLIQSNGEHYPALGIAVLEAYLDESLNVQTEYPAMRLGAQSLPVDMQGQLPLNFFDAHARQTISAADILMGTAETSSLNDKIVLIGVTSSDSVKHMTPVSFGADASEISLQADLIETLLSNRVPVQQDRLIQIVMVLLLALLAGATLPHVRILSAIGLTIVYLLLYIGYAFAEFTNGVVVQPIYPMLALLLTLAGTIVYRYFSIERHQDSLTRLMRRYLAPEAVTQAAEKFFLDALLLRGVRREVTVLAVDLSELETLSSSLTAEATVQLLNEYVSLIVRGIFRYEGAVAKHTGSAILAAWNFLIDQSDHAQLAVRAAVDIKHEVNEFNRRQPKELTIRLGMGVATGNVIVGRMGESSRAEYTIIGEIVGMAERISLKPERGVFIDVTTRERIGEEFDMIEVRPVRLRRKTDPSQVWLLVEPSETQTELTLIPVETEMPK